MNWANICLLVVLIAFRFTPLSAQQPLIALHHGGSASFFSSITAAYDAAVNGDTLFLPGGHFGALTIAKSLTLIGVGHHPDSMTVKGPTVFSSISLNAGSDDSAIWGAFVETMINTAGAVSNVKVTRCYIGHGFNFASTSTLSGWMISENYIGARTHNYLSNIPNVSFWALNLGSGTINNFLISNNVIYGRTSYTTISNSLVRNNVFLENGFMDANYTIFQNNVFRNNVVNTSTNGFWYNNLNAGINGTSGTNFGSGNYLDNVPLESVFLTYSPSNSFYANDFHVVNPAYTGDDGLPVGIFGGPAPWKEGSLPFNPHIQLLQVEPTTNPDGTLHINARVKAQQN